MTVATRSAALIVNPRAGAARRTNVPDHVAAVLSAEGIPNEVAVLGAHQYAGDLAREAVRQGFETIVACGGDGTVSAIAAALAGTEAAMGVLPTGTLNHFAKDLRIPLELGAAARVISGRKINRVDVGDVNGRTFINNSSLGIYPNIVLTRERGRRLGRNKWLAFVLAAARVLRRYPFVDVSIDAPGARLTQKTPFVFIGNNEYELRGLNIGSRRTLDAGRLYLYIAAPVSRLGLVWMAAAALTGRLDKTRTLKMSSVEEAWIETQRRRVHLAADGEVFHMRTPLHYTVRPRALRVIVP